MKVPCVSEFRPVCHVSKAIRKNRLGLRLNRAGRAAGRLHAAFGQVLSEKRSAISRLEKVSGGQGFDVGDLEIAVASGLFVSHACDLRIDLGFKPPHVH